MTEAKYFHWLRQSEECNPSGETIYYEDPLCKKSLVVPTEEVTQGWQEFCSAVVRQECTSPQGLADALVKLLSGKSDGTHLATRISPSSVGKLPSPALNGARLGDRALFFSAIAACLAHQNCPDDIHLIRIACLIAEMPEDVKAHVASHPALKGLTIPDSSRPQISLASIAASTPLGFNGREWVATGGQSDVSTSALEKHPLYKAGSVSLLMGGAQHVKGYFLESTKLPEIRGASCILDYVNRVRIGEVFGRDGLFPVPECLVYASGGSFLAFAPPGLALEVADAIERAYAEETLTASAAAATYTVDLLELQYGLGAGVACAGPGSRRPATIGGFGEVTTYLSGLVQLRRGGHPVDARGPMGLPYQPDTAAFADRCSSCARRAAVVKPNMLASEQPAPLCEACLRKALAGRFAKKSGLPSLFVTLAQHIGWDPTTKDGLVSWTEQFREFLMQSPDLLSRYVRNQPGSNVEEIKAPTDLKDIAGKSGDVGVIYADGNLVSSVLKDMKSPAEYRMLAERLDQGTTASVFSALARLLEPEASLSGDRQGSKVLVHPFEILSIGGDDLFLIVPAGKALAIACEICDLFESHFAMPEKAPSGTTRFQRVAPPPCASRITLAAGVVIGDASTPVLYLRNLADELLKSAKSRSRKSKTSCIDFQVLKSSGNILEGVLQYRKKHLTKQIQLSRGQGPTTIKLTAKPYTVAELKELLKSARAFAEASIPRTQLYALRTSLSQGKMRGMLEYLYARARAQSRAKLLFDELDQRWHGGSSDPWVADEDGGSFQTVIPDIIEIMPYIEEAGSRRDEAEAVAAI